jgi:hypothetical protein
MADDSIHLSFGDMLKGLVQEFSHALTLVKRYHPMVTVRSVRLNICQETALEEEQPTSPSPRTSLLLTDRYLGIKDKGWQMEVELGEGVSVRTTNIVVPVLDRDSPTALDIFGDLELVAVKGIDSDWSRIFAQVEITRISHLARMDDPLLLQLIESSHSLQPRDFRRKAQMLRLRLPTLPRQVPPRLDLYQLLQLSENDLLSLLSRDISIFEIRDLIDFLETLNIILDSDRLRLINLDQLTDSQKRR